jgi:acyl carrier protein
MNVDLDSVCKTIEAYVVSEFLAGDGEGLTWSSDLIRMGLIDSVSTFRLATFLDEEFKIGIDAAELVPGNLRTIEKLGQMVVRRVSGRDAG